MDSDREQIDAAGPQQVPDVELDRQATAGRDAELHTVEPGAQA